MAPPTKIGKQIKIVSYFTPDAIVQLKRLCAATRITQAVYLREALDDLLKKYAAAVKKAK
jgi:Ribbon-helix-helix domain